MELETATKLRKPQRVTLAISEEGAVVRADASGGTPPSSETFWIEFAAEAITAEAEDVYSAARDTESGQLAALCKVLADIITGWDVTWHSEPLAPDYEGMAKMPAWLLGGIASALFTSQRPDPEA